MTILPVRQLAEVGLLLDQPPFELPPNGWSAGANVRFRDGAVRRSSLLRLTRELAIDEPRAIFGFPQSTGYGRIFAGADDGTLWEVSNIGGTTDVTPAAWTPAVDPRSWTSALLGDVLYVNKPNIGPAYFPGGGATEFTPLPGWPTTQSARAIAASRDQLFAVNLLDGLTAFPNTVAWSDYALYGAPPSTWDPLVLGAVANKVTLAGASSPLVTCADLDGVMIVYGERQSWRFTFTGDTSSAAQNLWINEPLSNDRGAISPRAVAYYQRKHFVFGTDDLYFHDGVSVAPLGDGRVRRWLFRNLDVSKAARCFVFVDPAVDEILFAFPSKDGGAIYTAEKGCNRAIVYYPNNGRFSLVDLPDCTDADYGNFNPSTTWDDATTPWLTFGGSWADLADGYSRSAMVLAYDDAGVNIYALDEAAGGRVSFDAPVGANPPAFVERTGLDLDEIGAPLTHYKIVSSLFPQASVASVDIPLRIRVGAANSPAGPYTWDPWFEFYPSSNYKVDCRVGGRYLGVRFAVEPPVDFDFDGFDVDVRPGGRR